MRWKAAHLHAPSVGNIAGSEIHTQPLRCLFCVLAVYFKEIPNLMEYNVVRMRFFDGIIAVVGDGSRCSLCQLFVIKHLFIWCKIAVQADQFRDAGSDLIPIHLNIRTIALFQYDAFAAVFFKAAAFFGYSMGASASTVFFFQEISALFGRVLCLEKRIDAALSALKAAPVC